MAHLVVDQETVREDELWGFSGIVATLESREEEMSEEETIEILNQSLLQKTTFQEEEMITETPEVESMIQLAPTPNLAGEASRGGRGNACLSGSVCLILQLCCRHADVVWLTSPVQRHPFVCLEKPCNVAKVVHVVNPYAIASASAGHGFVPGFFDDANPPFGYGLDVLILMVNSKHDGVASLVFQDRKSCSHPQRWRYRSEHNVDTTMVRWGLGSLRCTSWTS